MKRWALLTVGLYVLALLVLAGPVILVAFWPHTSFRDVYLHRDSWMVAAWAGVFGLLQLGLLAVPVRLAGGRPMAKRHVFWTILAAGLLLITLAGAMLLGIHETMQQTEGMSHDWTSTVLWVVAGVWMLWGIIWAFYTGGKEPTTMMQRIVTMLIAGSILELLVAVPMHILARCRNYCCAGFGTFWGLAAGISIMLLAFGPSVFWLFVRRYRAIKPSSPSQTDAKNV